MFTSHSKRKRLGQHFLKDSQVILQILEEAHFQTEDHVIEIGPGLGALTAPLLTYLSKLAVIEYDKALIKKLRARFPQLTIYDSNILTFDLKSCFNPPKKLRIIGNLPYSISSPLLFHCLQSVDAIQDMHFMLQKEVVDRLTAPVGSRYYNRLSVMIGYYCEAEFLFSVHPQAFSPPPKVQSSVFRLTPLKPDQMLKAHDMHQFQHIVQIAFQQRRKMIQNSLASLISSKELTDLNICPTKRPQSLSIKDFIDLSNYLSQSK